VLCRARRTASSSRTRASAARRSASSRAARAAASAASAPRQTPRLSATAFSSRSRASSACSPRLISAYASYSARILSGDSRVWDRGMLCLVWGVHCHTSSA
jgi:hypothetical protein